MAFTTIPDSIIQVGKAVTRTLFSTYIKDNLDDLDSRMTSVEGTAGKLVIFNDIVVNGAGSASTITGIDTQRAASGFTLTDAKIYIFLKGSLTGTLEIDLKKSSSPDFTSAVSVFTTKPSIAYAGASNYEVSSNAAFDLTNKVVSAGDFFRLDITSMPSGGLGKFGIYIIGEPT